MIRAALKFGRVAGWWPAIRYSMYRVSRSLGAGSARSYRLKPRNAQHPVRIRGGNSSDFDVFRQVFVLEEYGCARAIKDPRCIIDLGANVGFASAYLLTCFPDASLLAVEPDPANYELLKQNLAPYGGRARPVLGAAWSRNATLRLMPGVYGDGREWATMVASSEEGEAGSVAGFDVPTLCGMLGTDGIDLLKIDIERSELELFDRSTCHWLDKVRNICIELHGHDCEEKVLSALTDFDYERSQSGELAVFRNIRRRSR
ncbi:MAG: FkbM family methyltransferase [Bryobacteraceae bacterium]|nr:FkbM family methyltransferase [Bryobacteraceae bacterium]